MNEQPRYSRLALEQAFTESQEECQSLQECLDERTAEMVVIDDQRLKLRKALGELLEQIDCLNGIEYSRDLEPYKAEACWDDALSQAQKVWKETEHAN